MKGTAIPGGRGARGDEEHERTVTAWDEALVTHGGALGVLIAEHDWSVTSLGPLQDWPESLRAAVSIGVTSRFPIVVFWGPDLVMLYNDAYAVILDTKHPQALGAPAKDVWPEIWDVIHPMFETVRSGGGATWSDDQLLVLNRNGFLEECYFTFSYSPILEPDGAASGIFCAVTETTQHVVYVRRFATLSRLASDLSDLSTPAEVCSMAERILSANAHDHPVVAVSECIDGVPVLTEGSGADVAELADAAAEAARTGRPVSLPVAAAPRKGPTTITVVHAVPVTLPGGSIPVAVITVGQNEQRLHDDAYVAYLEMAALHVQAALSAIQELGEERRRREVLEELEELDAQKNLLFINVSHELRTPLTLISGPIDALVADPTTQGETREELERVQRNTARLTRMVDAMLDFSRIEAGRLGTDVSEVDVSLLTRSLAESFQSTFELAGLDFRMECADLPRKALLDQVMYERIVLNLLSNALKYTPEGSVTLRLRDAGDEFEVSVVDTGVGIPPADHERIFGRFEQLPKHPRARTHEGAGIGLAMVKQLTNLLGGRVEVSSEVDRGSTFRIWLPYQAPDATSSDASVTPRGSRSFLAEAQAWQATVETQHRHTPTPPGADRRRVIVVDDNPDMRAYIEDTLANDYAVELLGDGQTALERIRECQPDLVLADIMMPGLDGLALVSELRQDSRTSDVPIILLSARAGEEATAAGLDVGADDYIVKPFSVAELRARLASNLERSRSRSRDAAWRRAVMTSFQDPLVITDEEGRVTELNDSFTALLGWSLDDGPIDTPHPWWPSADDEPEARARLDEVMEKLAHSTVRRQEVQLVARDGRIVWGSISGRKIDGTPDVPPLYMVTIRDLTREHAARERRETAARLSEEFSSAEDLEQVLSAAVAGFTELFDGDSTVRVMAGIEDHVFTAGGPMPSKDLPEVVVEALSGDPDAPPEQGPVKGILIAPQGVESECRAWIQFQRPRIIRADERIVGDLLARAFALAVDRVVAASEFADREANLELAIESHRLIGQAIGILVERHRITPPEAFVRLKRASQDRNIKLREIASRVIETGEEPSEAQ